MAIRAIVNIKCSLVNEKKGAIAFL